MKIGDLVVVNDKSDAGRYVGQSGIVIGFPRRFSNLDVVRVLLEGKICILRKTALDVLNEGG